MPITIPVESNWSSNNFSQFTSSLSLSHSSPPPSPHYERSHAIIPHFQEEHLASMELSVFEIQGAIQGGGREFTSGAVDLFAGKLRR